MPGSARRGSDGTWGRMSAINNPFAHLAGFAGILASLKSRGVAQIFFSRRPERKKSSNPLYPFSLKKYAKCAKPANGRWLPPPTHTPTHTSTHAHVYQHHGPRLDTDAVVVVVFRDQLYSSHFATTHTHTPTRTAFAHRRAERPSRPLLAPSRQLPAGLCRGFSQHFLCV